MRLPMALRNSLGIGPLLSMVKYEMQRRASSLYGAGKADVGQMSRQARHEPQLSAPALSRGRSSVVKIAPRNSHEPNSRETRLVCLPCQPNPAASAIGFSITAAVSTKTLTSPPELATSHRASAFRRFLITS